MRRRRRAIESWTVILLLLLLWCGIAYVHSPAAAPGQPVALRRLGAMPWIDVPPLQDWFAPSLLDDLHLPPSLSLIPTTKPSDESVAPASFVQVDDPVLVTSNVRRVQFWWEPEPARRNDLWLPPSTDSATVVPIFNNQPASRPRDDFDLRSPGSQRIETDVTPPAVANLPVLAPPAAGVPAAGAPVPEPAVLSLLITLPLLIARRVR